MTRSEMIAAWDSGDSAQLDDIAAAGYAVVVTEALGEAKLTIYPETYAGEAEDTVTALQAEIGA